MARAKRSCLGLATQPHAAIDGTSSSHLLSMKPKTCMQLLRHPRGYTHSYQMPCIATTETSRKRVFFVTDVCKQRGRGSDLHRVGGIVVRSACKVGGAQGFGG